MTSRSGKWRNLRQILAGILLILPLFQIAAPGLLALAAEDGVWCRSIAAIDGSSETPTPSQDADDCLVCIVAAIGGSSAAAAPVHVPAPRDGALATVQVSLTCPDDALALTQPPIRAPPAPFA